jgi:uncharacterized protein YxeA
MKTKLITGLLTLLFVVVASMTFGQSRNSYRGTCNYAKVQKYNKKQMKKSKRYNSKRNYAQR